MTDDYVAVGLCSHAILLHAAREREEEEEEKSLSFVNDPLGQTHSLAISEHYCFHLVLFC